MPYCFDIIDGAYCNYCVPISHTGTLHLLVNLLFQIKLSIAGKDTVKEEDFDELTSDSLFKDNDISSISGSEDEDDKETGVNIDVNKESRESVKRKIFVHLHTGERVSVWRCLLLDESVNISFENDKFDDGVPCLTEREVIEKLKYLIHEPRDSTHLRVVLLARGGHFAACVFDGNSVVAHKTFHRLLLTYVFFLSSNTLWACLVGGKVFLT